MIILSFSGYYIPGYKGGGPIKTIKNLFDQTGEEVTYKLITSDTDLGGKLPYTEVKCGAWNKVGNADVFYTQSGMTGIKQISKIVCKRKYDLVYLNSFFSIRFSIYPFLISKILKNQIVIGPRGEFSRGALALKSVKKRLFIKLYKLFSLQKGIVFQASSEYEAEDIRRVLGNEVDIFISEDIGSQEYAKTLLKRSEKKLNIVFISRISPKKNLLGALEILKNVQSPISYHIYGPIEDFDYWEQCKCVISQLPPYINIEYKGELTPENVVPKLSDYDLFFMPTLGENYGHVIAEALCAGLPLLIADTTPWRDLEEQGVGWDISLNTPEKFSNVIDNLANISDCEYLIIRETVLNWAKEKFTQRDAIEANLNMFRYAYEKRNIS